MLNPLPRRYALANYCNCKWLNHFHGCLFSWQGICNSEQCHFYLQQLMLEYAVVSYYTIFL
uniref:Uncharacterized protein n=1 Tax=Oryza brachyantha TaxID=4533 RepID=J3KX18_ORYBR